MKKIISLLISVIIAVQLLVLPVSAEENSPEYILTMQNFGVLTGDENLNGTFSIADLSAMVYRLLNPGSAELEATRQIYTDVDRWHWAAGYVEWLYNNNVYTGDGSGALEPERDAKLSDVCQIMLNLLGYQKVMDYIGDDTDVIKKATEIQLLSSKVSKTEHEITYGEFASVCYELFFTEVIESNFSEDVGFSQGGEFIDEIMGLKYAKGVMTAANGYSLTYALCDTDKVIIDGNIMQVGDKSYIGYLGYNVKYYYNDSDELIAAVPIKNTELVIQSADIVSYENNRYTYEVDSKGKKANVSADVMVLYNGKISTNRAAFIPSYGQIRLIDNNGDSKYDCIISENAYNVVVNNIKDGIIYGKNTNSSGSKYTIDTNKLELLRIVADGAEIPLSEVEAGTVITAVVSEDGEYALLYVTDKSISGKLTKYTQDEEVVVDGTEYEPAKNIFNPNAIVTGQNDVEILRDVYGNIAAILGTYQNKYYLGYLISVKVNDEEERLLMKILTSDSQVKKFYSAEKIYIDGTKVTSAYSAETLVKTGELIKYRITNGEISYIDTASQQAGFENFPFVSDKNSLRMIAKGKMQYKSSPQVFKKYTTMDMYSEFAVTDKTPIFFVPTEEEYTNDSDYYVAGRTSLRADLQAEIQAYVTGRSTLVAEAVVVNYTTSIVLADGIAVVGSITESLNSDDEVVYTLKVMRSGKEIEICVPDKELLISNGEVIKGSVIRYKANKDGEVKAIQHLYSPEGGGLLSTNAKHTYTSGSSGMNANLRVMLGSIYDREGTVSRFRFKDSVADDEIFNLKSCNIYVYDADEQEPLRAGNIDDVHDFAHYGSSCDEVIVATRAVSASDVILIRK